MADAAEGNAGADGGAGMTDAHQAPGLVKVGDRDDWRINFVVYGGPWIVECGLTDANPELGDTIAKVMVSYGADGRDRDFKTTQRRAYVLAAAPMLLAALELAADYLKDHDGGDPSTETGWKSQDLLDAWLAARAAIAKATVPS